MDMKNAFGSAPSEGRVVVSPAQVDPLQGASVGALHRGVDATTTIIGELQGGTTPPTT